MSGSDEDKAGSLIFFVNGKKISEKCPDPRATLLQYLRRKLHLPGTKEGCGHGGCGSCTVMVSKYDVINKRIQHYAVNACLFPLCAAHGLAITTVEGVGNPATGLHAIQQRLIEMHGLQCGFCTPGFVMSAFALLRNNPKPTREQVEQSIEGNLCRCTGYRPILDALLTFTEENCQMGEACCKSVKEKVKNEDRKEIVNDSKAENQVPIFPPELQLNGEHYKKEAQFTDGNYTWFTPVQLEQLLVLKHKYQRAPIIMGNTTTARFVAEGAYDDVKVFIYGGSVQELKTMKVTNEELILGGACTLSELAGFLETSASKLPGYQSRHYQAIQDMVSRYGSKQIRNVSTVAGSLVSGRSNSDIKTLFKALGATVTFTSVKRSRTVHLNELQLNGNDVITSVNIPLSFKKDISAFYKQTDRRSFSLAIVNAGMFAKISAENKVTDLRLCFGGILQDSLLLTEVSELASERLWDESLLHNVLSVLADVLSVDNGHKVDSYKLSIASALWFKFFNTVKAELKICEPDMDLIRAVASPPYSSKQVFDACTSEQQATEDALGRTVANVHSDAAVSGEAIYTDDLPHNSNELFVALVLSAKARAKILNVDLSKALAVPGVHGYIDHTDIPGRNGFGSVIPDQELFCSGQVMSVGQPVCGIIAENREIAQCAVSKVTVEYEEMTPILTIEEAIAERSFYGEPLRLNDGDVTRGLAESDHVITGEYQTGLQEHFYMEPHAAVVVPKENEELEINCTCQNLSGMQKEIAQIVRIPQHKITCKVKRIGGSFGGKEMQNVPVTGSAAVAAVKTKQPVRCVLPRATDMLTTGKRHPFLGKYKVGFDENGKMTSLDLKLYSNGGYSMDVSSMVLGVAMQSVQSVYKVKNIQVEGYVCKTNIPSSTALRGFGRPQAALIMEDIIFQIARKLNITSEKVREENLFSEGKMTLYGKKLDSRTLPEIWQTCKEESKYECRLKEVKIFNSKNRWKKRGISMTASKYRIGFEQVFMYQGAALVNIYTDGSVLVAHGGIEVGQGLNTKLIQIASAVLGIPKRKIHTIESSTREIPNAIVTGGSMGTDLYGPAVKDACETLNERLISVKEAMPDATWEKLISTAFFKRIQLSATGFYSPPKEAGFNMETKVGRPFNYFTNGVAY